MDRVISVDATFNGRKVMWDRDGYPYGWLPEHQMARKKSWKGYVPLHRYYKSLDEGRILNREEVVHHINGMKNDERKENLVILTKSEHSFLHKKVECGICTLDDAKDYESVKRIVSEPIRRRRCSSCGAELWYKDCSITPVFLCPKCSQKKQEKAKWPSDEELQKMVFVRTYTSIAEELGVSVTAVRKRVRTHGLIDPLKKPRKNK